MKYALNNYRGYMIMFTNDSYKVTVTLSWQWPFADIFITHRESGASFGYELSKDQITQVLSFDNGSQLESFAFELHWRKREA